jgi:hypothetical protein
MIKLVMGRGSNASGKTTIAKDLIALNGKHPVELLTWKGPLFVEDTSRYPKVYATVMRHIGWACIGSYPVDKKMGGCDTLNTIYKVKRAIADTLNNRGELRGIYFEGMMVSTITSTWYDFMMDLKHYDVDPYFVVLISSVEGCLKRIEQRGTQRQNLSIENIANKCKTAIRSGHNLEALGGIPVKWMNTDTTPRNCMLPTFAEFVDDYDLLTKITRI